MRLPWPSVTLHSSTPNMILPPASYPTSMRVTTRRSWFRHAPDRRAPVFERLEASGTVVGLLPGCSYQQACFEMRPGDVLVAFTDGITEAMNADGELWGEERLLAALATCDGLAPSEILVRIMAMADRFAAGAKQNDDMTLIVARVVG